MKKAVYKTGCYKEDFLNIKNVTRDLKHVKK